MRIFQNYINLQKKSQKFFLRFFAKKLKEEFSQNANIAKFACKNAHGCSSLKLLKFGSLKTLAGNIFGEKG